MKYQDLAIYGRHAIEGALRSPYVAIKQIRGTAAALETLWEEFPEARDLSDQVRPQDLPKDKRHQGLTADLRWTFLGAWGQWDSEHRENCRTILMLDHLQDPQNLGNALRHAQAFGVDLVVIAQHGASPINGTVAMASTGSLFALPILQVSSLIQCVQELKKDGFGILGSALAEQAQPFSPELFWAKSVIIVGAEGPGMRQGLMKTCDTLMQIPMASGVQSLNAATTAALLCYERYKQLTS